MNRETHEQVPINLSIHLKQGKIQNKYIIDTVQKMKLPINPNQDGVGAKRPPTSFSLVTSTNVGISPQNFLTFSFNPLPQWCKISSLYLVPV